MSGMSGVTPRNGLCFYGTESHKIWAPFLHTMMDRSHRPRHQPKKNSHVCADQTATCDGRAVKTPKKLVRVLWELGKSERGSNPLPEGFHT
jgi:hypothetical protein